MTRLLLPRILDAVELDDLGTLPHGVAALAIDATDDEYLVIDRGGNSRWVAMADVLIVDDLVRAASGRGEDMARLIVAEREVDTPSAAA